MFCCHQIREGKTYLAKHLAANDYYEEGRSIVGHWLGRGAELLGLDGTQIEPGNAAFAALRTNRHPCSGGKLTFRDRRDRIAFYDLVCSAPKSVSILAVTFGDERLREAHDAAVAVAFAELERFAGRRTAEKGANAPSETRVTGNIVAAAFTHDSSRELEAQLHTHCVCANATLDPDGSWYALDNRVMFLAVEMVGRVYQNELAYRCRTLGYEVREERSKEGGLKGFEVVGLTPTDLELQSTRRKQVEVEIARFLRERGRNPSAAERHKMATDTRAEKLTEITTTEVRAKQLGKYADEDRERLFSVVRCARRQAARVAEGKDPAPSLIPAQEAVAFAADHIFERCGVVPEHKIVACALAAFPGLLDFGAVRLATKNDPKLVRLDTGHPGTGGPEVLATVTTKENLAAERELIDLVSSGRHRCPVLGAADQLPETLKPDQRRALETLLGARDQVLVLRGPAGAGKTYVLQAFASALRAGGTETLFVAPTHKAKQELQKSGFETADTIAMFLGNLAVERVSVRGKVLVVDEAGMASTRDAVKLLRTVIAAGARVLLVGDEKQLRSVDPGDTLRLLKQYSGATFAELTEIRRQQANPEYLRAAQAMSEGRVRDGLAILDACGWVFEGGGDYLENAISDFLRRGSDSILVAPTWREVDRLNQGVRDAWLRDGRLGSDRLMWPSVVVDRKLTAAQRRVGRSYEPGMLVSIATGRHLGPIRKGQWLDVVGVDGGRLMLKGGATIDLKRDGARLLVGRPKDLELRIGDRLLLQQNDRRLGLTNGTLVTVCSCTYGRVVVVLPNCRRVDLPRSYRMLTHGYAVTTEASQGATCDTAIFAASAADDVRRYVGLTRGRHAVAMHVPDRAELFRMARNTISGRPLALDYWRRSVSAISGERVSISHLRLAPPSTAARPRALAVIGAVIRRLLLARRRFIRAVRELAPGRASTTTGIPGPKRHPRRKSRSP